MKTARTKNKVLAVLFVLLATTAYGQDGIYEVLGTGKQTIVRSHGTSQIVTCHQSNSNPYFTVVEENDTIVRVIEFPSTDTVLKITDFYVEDSVIYMCGKLGYNSSWFVGDLPYYSTGTPILNYVILPNVSNLAKVGQLYNLFNAGIVTAGNDNNGNAILIETYFNGPYFQTYTIPLVDTTSTKNIVDDMIVISDYIVVSAHPKTNTSGTKKGSLWFIDNPCSSGSSITNSYINYENTLYGTKEKVFLAKKTGNRFYASSSASVAGVNTPKAVVSIYLGLGHQKTLYLAAKTKSLGHAYNSQSNAVEMIASITTTNFPTNHTSYCTFTFDGDLYALSGNAPEITYGNYIFHSIDTRRNLYNRFVVSGEDAPASTGSNVRLFLYTSGQSNGCSSSTVRSLTSSNTQPAHIPVANIPVSTQNYTGEVNAIIKYTKKTAICQ